LAYRLTHPKFNVEKKYYAVTEIDIANSKLKNAPKGIELDTGEIARCQIFRLDKQGKKLLWKIIITEGKNREIKRIFQALGSRVESLHRYEFAGLNVERIKLGKYRRLRKSEISMLTSLTDKK
jgi:23S rRNA pseudouridine2605 synthase